MTLRLSVVSEHAIRLGQHSTKVFGVHGGTIGRGTDNAWILPDPERYLSGKHVRIDFRAGSYVLVDTSSTGTYVNGSQVPLGKYHDYVLKDGDYVRLGEYELLVSIDKGTDFPPDSDAVVAYDGQSPSSAVKKSTANDLGADLDLSQLLEPSDQLDVDTGIRPRNAYGQAVTADRDANVPSANVPSANAPSANAPTPWHMMTRPLKVAGKTDEELAPLLRSQGPALYEGDFDLGLVALNQGRNDFRNRFRIPTPANNGPESPLNLSQGVDEALVRLLTTVSTRLGSVEAIRENFRELKAQNTASLAAIRAAFEEFLGRVDPKELEERFDRATKRGVFGAQNKGKYWDLYSEMFTGLSQRPADGFPHLFVEAFAKSYEAKLRTLIPPRRSAFGADRDESDKPPERAVGDQ